MAKYRIILSKKAYKFITKLNRNLAHKTIKEISDLENFPFFTKRHDLAKLKGRKNYYRPRIGKIRAIFSIDKETKTIMIQKIAYRREAYK